MLVNKSRCLYFSVAPTDRDTPTAYVAPNSVDMQRLFFSDLKLDYQDLIVFFGLKHCMEEWAIV